MERNLSQEKLAKKSGLDKSYIFSLERRKAQPTLETLFRLASALKVNPNSIVSTLEGSMI